MMTKIETNNSAPSVQPPFSRECWQIVRHRFASCQQTIDQLASQALMYKISAEFLTAASLALISDSLLSSACQATLDMGGGSPSILSAVVCTASKCAHYITLPLAVGIPLGVGAFFMGLSMESRIRTQAVAAAAEEQKQHPSISSPEKKQV